MANSKAATIKEVFFLIIIIINLKEINIIILKEKSNRTKFTNLFTGWHKYWRGTDKWDGYNRRHDKIFL